MCFAAYDPIEGISEPATSSGEVKAARRCVFFPVQIFQKRNKLVRECQHTIGIIREDFS
jgi:hypothetical protein